MQIIPTNLSKGVVTAGVLICIITIAFVLVGHNPWAGIPLALVALVAGAWIVLRLQLQNLILLLLPLALPFSTEVPFLGNSMLRVPGEPLIILALLVFILELAQKPFPKSASPVFKEIIWIFPLMGLYLLVTPFSQIPMVSAKFVFINLLYIAVFYLFFLHQLHKNPDLFPTMLLLYSLGVIVVLGWALLRFGQWEWNPVVVRGIFQPFYKDHTIWGAATALLAGYWLATTFASKRISTVLVASSLGIVMIFSVLLSTSRAAFLSILIFAGTYVFLRMGLRLKHLYLFLLAGMLLLGLFQQNLTERFRQTQALSYDSNAGWAERTQSVTNLTTDVSNIERLNRWIAAWRMFREKPFTGHGPGTYQFTYIPYQEPSFENRLTVTDPYNIPEGSGGTAHSEYLLLLSEAGIAGLLAWLIILGRWTWIAITKSRNHPNRSYIITGFTALSTYLFHAFFNNFLTTDKFAFLFWGTAAWMMASFYQNHNADSQNAGPGLQGPKNATLNTTT